MRISRNLVAIVIVVMTVLSCQQEVDEMRVPPPATAFIADSNVADLIRRATLHDGSYDNIIDGASCISLLLPVTVFVDGQEVVVASTDDYRYVEQLVDETGDDVTIVFPVTVLLADYTQVPVGDDDDFENIVNDCIEGGIDDDIECIDFVYPFTISVYDANNQVADVVIVEGDEDLFDFVDELDDGAFAAFTFPLTVRLSNGTELIVGDNDELEEAIDDWSDDCDEDDDNDFDDDDIDDSSFTDVLLSGSWRVEYFFDDSDQTAAFSGFTFTFFADGATTATNGTITLVGDWETLGDDGELELDLDYGDDDPLDEISEDWIVVEYDANSITLQEEDDDDEPVTTLVFERL